MTPFERSLVQFQGYLRLERQSSNNTVAAYSRALRKWENFALQAGLNPLEMTQEGIAAFIKSLKELGSAGTTVAQTVAALRSWVNFRRLEGESGKLWTPQLPDKPAALPQVLTEGEVERLVAAAAGDEPIDLRDRAMITLLAECGLRASEICSLRPGDINREERFFSVTGKGNKDRTVPFTPKVFHLLNQWLDVRQAWAGKAKLPLFITPKGRAMTRIDLWRMIRARGGRAGIAKARLHPHVLRHTIATRLLRKGMDLRALQELLGHSSIGTTEKYLHFDLELREVYDRCHPHAGEPEGDRL